MNVRSSPEEMRTYDESLKIYWDNYSVIETAKHEGRQEGRREGRQEGRREGRQEGRKEGWQEGRQEERVEIARQMKKEGDSIEKIARITGLPQEQIEKL